MPERSDMSYFTMDYVYDGTLNGLYCCVFESFYARELPSSIQREAEVQPSMFAQKRIMTDGERALRVRDSIPKRISHRALELVETVFLSCMEEKEMAILKFLQLGYSKGRSVTDMLSHPAVAPLLKAEKHLLGENHLLLGFLRFSDYDGMLAATITPKNFVLPFMANHFASRYSEENFLIYDKTHKAALLYKGGKMEMIELESIEFNEPSAAEKGYRALWKRFYDTIAIEARKNPRCRMTHMPKRYWENMIEMQDQY